MINRTCLPHYWVIEQPEGPLAAGSVPGAKRYGPSQTALTPIPPASSTQGGRPKTLRLDYATGGDSHSHQITEEEIGHGIRGAYGT